MVECGCEAVPTFVDEEFGNVGLDRKFFRCWWVLVAPSIECLL